MGFCRRIGRDGRGAIRLRRTPPPDRQSEGGARIPTYVGIAPARGGRGARRDSRTSESACCPKHARGPPDVNELTPEMLISAYVQGYFPMDVEGDILWFSPDPRTILPLDSFHASKTL